jgi:16S rRNA (uracil1498-N3)-methyltransferase
MGRDGFPPMSAHDPRFAIAADAIAGHIARVTGDELHHLRDVMRLRAGDRVALIADDGEVHEGAIESIEPACATVLIARSYPNPPSCCRLILAAGLIKAPRMDFLVEKAAELGAAELWPLICARSPAREPGAQRLARWERIAVAAAKQSLAPMAIRIRPPRGIAELIRDTPKDACAIACEPDGEPLTALIRRVRPATLILACGPEGGFDPDEAAAMSGAGFAAVGLGPNRLRSETAALAALGAAAATLDEIHRGS